MGNYTAEEKILDAGYEDVVILSNYSYITTKWYSGLLTRKGSLRWKLSSGSTTTP